MQTHNLKKINPNKKSRRIGRGGKRGKTSGRGTKGQKARAGHRIRPEIRDEIKRLPKRRGYGKNRSRTVNSEKIRPHVVNLNTIAKHFASGDTVSPQTLFAKKLISRAAGKLAPVKILGEGNLDKKLTFTKVTFSLSARAAIEKAGGKVE